MPKRFCLDCGQLYDRDATGTHRCLDCQPAIDQAARARRARATAGRPGTVARGYGKAHRAKRAEWAPVVDAGQARCVQPTCLEPSRRIEPGTSWDLAHNADRTGWLGPAHARCNRGARPRL